MLAMVPATARQRVMELLTRQPASSATQIGRMLRLSAATVRYHLRFLQADGRVVATVDQHTAGRGRPSAVYRISDRMLGDNLPMIADRLLAASIRKSTAARSGVLDVLVSGLLVQLGPSDPKQPAVRRLGQLMEKLNALHYQATWEAGAQGPRILFAHCPYAAIIDKHPELCLMDTVAVGRQMNTTAEQVARIDLNGRTVTHCVLVLK